MTTETAFRAEPAAGAVGPASLAPDAVPDASLCAFLPSAARGRAVDRRVRDALRASLTALLGAFAEQGAITPAEIDRVLAAVDSQPIMPALFGAYSDLVDATFRDAPEAATEALAALVHAAGRSDVPPLRFVTLDDAALGPGMTARYVRLLDDDPDVPVKFQPLPPDELAGAARVAGEAFALLDRAAPEIAGELRAMISEIVFVGGGSGEYIFHGAATFYLWGALFMNASRFPDRLGMAEGIVHEAAHSLLHGLTYGAPLVENPRDERYPSPLRYDPRPMDGIAHATYVLARMDHCVQQLLASGTLTEAERDAALARSRSNRGFYAEGLEQVDAHARFTPTGARVFDAARAHMRATAGV